MPKDTVVKKRILVIDDDPLVLKTVTKLLLTKSYEVVGCKSGADAVMTFQKQKFDLAVCDIRMAEQDGIETIKRIREFEHSSERPPIPVIMITGNAPENTPIAAIKAGVQDYLLKPFGVDELVKSIELHLQRADEFSAFSQYKRPKIQFSILGIGIVSPFGFTKKEFWDYVNACSLISKPVINAVPPGSNGYYAMRVKNFSPEKYFDEKQLHNLDNNSIFIAAAAKNAISDSNISIPKIGSDKVGVSIGTSISIATSMSDFDESVLKFGSRRSRIGIFPNTVMCAPASRVSIFEHITGSNTTISSGMNSGMDAIGHACFCLESNIAEVMIAGGSDALSDKILLGYQKEKLLFHDADNIKRNRRGAFVPSEGACVLVLNAIDEEHPESAVYGKILSYASGFSPFKKREVNARAEVFITTLRNCLEDAELQKNDLGCIVISSYFDEFDYAVEACALNLLFKETIQNKPVFAPKKILGESFAAFSVLAVLFVVGLFQKKINREALKRLNENKSAEIDTDIKPALIIQIDSAGHHSAMILQPAGR